MVAPELSYRAVADSGKDEVRLMFVLEEFVVVFILLVGILHLMEAATPKLLQSAFWNPKDGNSHVAEYDLASGAGFSLRHRDMSLAMDRIGVSVNALKWDVDRVKSYMMLIDSKLNTIYELETYLPAVRTVQKSKQSSEEPAQFTLPCNKKLLVGGNDANKTALLDVNEPPRTFNDTLWPLKAALPSPKPPLKLNTYAPVPFMLVFQVCILLAGVSRAFLSAHLSLHVSVYNACMGTLSLASVCLLITGGCLAAGCRCSGFENQRRSRSPTTSD